MVHMVAQKPEEQLGPEAAEKEAMDQASMSKETIHIIIRPKMEAMELPIPGEGEEGLDGNIRHNMAPQKGVAEDLELYY